MGGTVIPYPCKPGGIYPFPDKSAKTVIPKSATVLIFIYPLSPKVFRQLSLRPQKTYSVIPYP